MFKIICQCGETSVISEKDNKLQTFFGDQVFIQSDKHYHIMINCEKCGHKMIFKSEYQ